MVNEEQILTEFMEKVGLENTINMRNNLLMGCRTYHRSVVNFSNLADVVHRYSDWLKPTRPIPFQTPEEVLALWDQIAREYPLLDDVPENGQKIGDFLQKEASGYITIDNLRAAVEALKSQLQWVVPAPPTPEPEAEKLESWQLPLDCTEYEMHRASPQALKDFIQRARETKKKSL